MGFSGFNLGAFQRPSMDMAPTCDDHPGSQIIRRLRCEKQFVGAPCLRLIFDEISCFFQSVWDLTHVETSSNPFAAGKLSSRWLIDPYFATCHVLVSFCRETIESK